MAGQSEAQQLCDVSCRGDIDRLTAIANKSNVNCSHRGFTPLMKAALGRNDRAAECVKLLLLLGADVEASDAVGKTAAHYAAFRDNREVISLLFAKSESVLHRRTARGDTPLMWAASMNHVYMVALLMELGADPHERNRRGKTALHLATEFTAFSCIHFLAFVIHGKAVTHEELRQDFLIQERGEALGKMAQAGDLTRLKQLGKPEFVNYRWHSRPIITWAAGSDSTNSADCVSHLIKLGADSRVADWQGWTAMHRAAKAGNDTAIRTLPNSLLNVKDTFGETPLMLAAYFGRESAARVLLKEGASVEVKDSVGGTAVTKACTSEIKDLLAAA